MRDGVLLGFASQGVVARKEEICKITELKDFVVKVSDSPLAYVTLFQREPLKTDDGEVVYDNQIAEFGLTQLEGCCGVVVSCHVKVHPEFRGKGLGQLLLTIREAAVISAGYTVIMATSIANNAVENHILVKNGYKPMNTFTNARTNHLVTMWQKNLRA